MATSQEARLEHWRPLQDCPRGRRCCCKRGLGSGRNHGCRCARHAAQLVLGTGELAQVGQQASELLGEVVARQRLEDLSVCACCGFLGEAPLSVFHAASWAIEGASCADLRRLLVADLGWAVAWVAEVVRHPWGVQQRGVVGAGIDDLDGEAEDEEAPGHNQGDEACLHVEPRRRLAVLAQSSVNVTALPFRNGLCGQLARCGRCLSKRGSTHLPCKVRLAWLQSARGRHQPSRVLESPGQAPGCRPPRSCWYLCHVRRRAEVRRTDPEQLDGVDELAGVGEVHQDVADGRDVGVVVAPVLDARGRVRKELGEGAHSLPWNANLVGHDVQRQDDLLENEKWDHHGAAHEEGACLCHLVGQHHEAPAVGQVHEGQEDAQAGVDVVRPPLVLDLAVDLEVLGRGALSSEGHHRLEALTLVDALLLAEPSRDVVPMACTAQRVRVRHTVRVEASTTVLACMAEERHAEHLA
mmetsp:Transcript_76401/g.123563  ORF Transcript_76401/g.123563 Transcript_76401/m.123563 type:complete len:468 (+) Transcript_76401:992-2395(+)